MPLGVGGGGLCEEEDIRLMGVYESDYVNEGGASFARFLCVESEDGDIRRGVKRAARGCGRAMGWGVCPGEGGESPIIGSSSLGVASAVPGLV